MGVAEFCRDHGVGSVLQSLAENFLGVAGATGIRNVEEAEAHIAGSVNRADAFGIIDRAPAKQWVTGKE